MNREVDPAELIGQALDVVALGYPFEGSVEVKTAWMVALQKMLEGRKAKVQTMTRKKFKEM